MQQKHIVINGFSADAISILAARFNSLEKRGCLTSISYMTKKDRAEGKACLTDSSHAILCDICAFLGTAPYWNVYNIRKKDGSIHESVESDRLIRKYRLLEQKDFYMDAIQEVAKLFNQKAKLYKLDCRLEFTGH